MRRILAVSGLLGVLLLGACTLPGPVPPGMPGHFKVTTGNASVTMTWTAPAGGTATSYRVSRDGTDLNGAGPVATTLPLTARSYTFSALAPATRYTFALQAINKAGKSVTVQSAVTVIPTYVDSTLTAANAFNPVDNPVGCNSATPCSGRVTAVLDSQYNFTKPGGPDGFRPYHWSVSAQVTRLFGCVDQSDQYTNVKTLDEQLTTDAPIDPVDVNSVHTSEADFFPTTPTYTCPAGSYEAAGGTRVQNVVFSYVSVLGGAPIGSIRIPNTLYVAPDFS